ncbi:hypothetical protein HL658_04605 [Azospirillum sp. RWY-5-1]|uniref:Cyclophilin-like domain-containing protein n=1 Tax=Azospirillum oleiclasticum TaxID=2735135 RepID=A0ABX2T6S9_9PROT|nr:cyclophilin-like fold protein [Azospirillum oleiclasticum]NYZ11821.1 hypothetical protein [Azospirillum oleiclasticum]NYZ18981.1 hypothetical protein [Azospirillum oleiclasticum]
MNRKTLRNPALGLAAILGLAAPVSAAAQEQIRISSDWGSVTAELVDNAATRSLLALLPLTLPMRDHLRQEKTGALPASLPDAPRRRDFTAGTVGLWSADDFVIYYRDGEVPGPGIVILGRLRGDASLFDRPGPVTVTVTVERMPR